MVRLNGPAILCRKNVTAVAATLLLSACGIVQEQAPAPAAAPVANTYPPAFPTETLVGSWGLASYRDEADRARTESMARQQCKNPYVIARGPTDGVIMHVADDPTPHELKLKGSSDGKTYLGFEAPPGHYQDREIISYSNDIIVMKFVSPDVNTRYGTFIYVRCPV